MSASHYSYMSADHAAETTAIAAHIVRLLAAQPHLKGDDLLNQATVAAGYVMAMSGVERCDHCGAVYHRDYGGEYVDPSDNADLFADLPDGSVAALARLEYKHFCDFICLQSAVAAQRECEVTS